MKRKRIDLQFREEYSKESLAWEKVRNYDKERYRSMSDYIIHAINAYQAPVCILPEQLKKEIQTLIREELSSDDFL